MSEYKYRLLKSSWGIAIDVSGHHKILKDEPISGELVSQGVWLNLEVNTLTPKEKEFVFEAIQLASKDILPKLLDNEKILFVISQIDFSLCDYQPEGLVIAIWGWANQELGLAPPNINASFDPINNKYVINLK